MEPPISSRKIEKLLKNSGKTPETPKTFEKP
jgi:hypothetical protein